MAASLLTCMSCFVRDHIAKGSRHTAQQNGYLGRPGPLAGPNTNDGAVMCSSAAKKLSEPQ